MQQLIQIVRAAPLLRQARRWTHLRGSSGQPTQSFAMLLQPALQRADQALFELIQALCLRAEACGGLTSAARPVSQRRRSRCSSSRRRMQRCSRAPNRTKALRIPRHRNRKFRGRGGVGARTSAAKSAMVKSIS